MHLIYRKYNSLLIKKKSKDIWYIPNFKQGFAFNHKVHIRKSIMYYELNK